ncbi:type II secretion system F family protein [uncultured Oscillibacter sp.]|uniref:type II secretion system F family protein n=1 Tax=uncultured Oscillibacter sp. TaxID=876091 RepID=UPI00262FED8F|nr:type II secretion system F family protein [uncultured Oscillibacter sp.]
MKRTLSYGEIAEVSLELSLLLHAGVGTGDALYLLGEDSPHKKLLSAMADEVDGGAALASAMRSSAAFPTYACGLVEVGERTGRTEEALAALSRYYEDRVRMDRRVRSALLYPAVMLALMLVVIGVLLVKVLPIFDDVYASLGTRLTGVAAGLLTVGRWLEGALPVFWAVLAAQVLIGFLFTAVGPLRRSLVSFWQRGHGDRGVSRKLNNARLAQAMAMGMASGLPLEEALGLSAGLVEGGARRRCEDCRKRLDNGEALSAALKASGLLPASQSRLLELGQRGGAGDASMEKIARDLSEEGEAALDAAVSRVEPALVLLCSVLVGLILLSVMLPLMHIMSAIG